MSVSPPPREEEVRPSRAEVERQIDAFMESSGGLREYDRFVLRLCRAYLAQEKVIAAARLETEDVLLAWYATNPVAVADICDEHIDPSGALLGRIRERAAALSGGGETETP